MYYFGYGSNLRASFVTELIPSATLVMKAYLPNYEVQWRAWSEAFGGGISSICETPGEIVQGVIYQCTEKELKKLDYIPGIYVPKYTRETFVVLGEDGEWHSVELYRLWELKGPFPPSRPYVEGMLEGAKQIGVSQDYLEKIEDWLRQSILLESDEP
jgi:gamma-glutamylcyclotransferase